MLPLVGCQITIAIVLFKGGVCFFKVQREVEGWNVCTPPVTC